MPIRRSCVYFKYPVRKCKEDVTKNSAESLDLKLLEKSDAMFWKEIKKLNNTHVPVVSTIAGVTGPKSIINMWQHHFKSLLNSSSDKSRKDYVLNKVANADNDNCYIDRFTVEDVKEAMRNIK